MRWLASVVLLLAMPAWAAVTRTALPGPDRFTLEATLPVSRAALLPMLEQPCQVRQWMPHLRDIRILHRLGPDQTLVYMAREGSWPVSNRDAITLFRRQAGEPLVLTMEGQPDVLPARPGYVRMPYIKGSWTLYDQGRRTRVVYRQRLDPGGSLPQWLADSVAGNHIEETLKALEHYVRDPHPDACAVDRPADGGTGQPLW
ncbi:phosphatidylcholine transfer protein [Alcanivorax hongdengensis A-11-3]|uniref:Phosphatidylcholine transfer protein n=1 Tax=Alcanivorax hongdengensis A-11-3 TaxID=1177179 RepID=L0WD20_9GAMM|nr:START domain-containing protein [Alcanivorax hongdengensis]EKF73650.1 phosphatidylcholine transfer protein [Alcanivorax hongdengensis A-11-3]